MLCLIINFADTILGETGLDPYPNLKRLFDEVSARPAAGRVQDLKQRLSFKTDFDDEARRALFPLNE